MSADDDAVAAALAELRRQGLPSSAGPSEQKQLHGPTSSSNIVIPGVLLWGDVPKGKKLAELLEFGVTEFLDLRPAPTELYLPASPPLSADGGLPLRHHQLDIGAFVSTGAVGVVAAFIRSVFAQTLNTRTMLYVHCKDGHAVSGMVVCALLSCVYGLTMLKAASVCAQLHSCRHDTDTAHGMFNAAQKVFLRALCAEAGPIRCTRGPSAAHSGGGEANNAIEGSCRSSVDVLAGGQNNFVLGSGAKGSRFEHSQGGGGGKTSLNIFDAPPVPSSGGNSPNAARGNAVTSPEESPTRRGRALVPGRSPETLHPGGGQRPSPIFAGAAAADATAMAPSVASSLVLGSSSRSGGHQDPRGHHHHADPLQPTVEAPDSTTTVTVLARPTSHHAWGLVLRGTVVQRVLPRSPAAIAGLLPHMQLLLIDGEAYDGAEGLDWVTMDKTSVTVVVADRVHVHTSRPGLPETLQSFSPTGGAPVAFAARDVAPPQQQPRALEAPTAEELPAVPRWVFPRDRASIAGPTPMTHWVVPGLLLCGPVPEPRHPRVFELLAREGFDVFVSLVEALPSATYVAAYEAAAGKNVRRVLSLPLPDGRPLSGTTAGRVLELAAIVSDEVQSGSKVYLHCNRGHGRAGMLASCVLANLYGLSGMEAVNRCDALHSCRKDTEDRSSPESQEQRLSVVALIGNRKQQQ